MTVDQPSIGRQIPRGSAPRIIGHAGCAGQYPENTIAAVESAAPHVDGFELDVRSCGTGELVMFHDETLERVTNGTGRVDETPLSDLRALRVLESESSIPTLEELLRSVSPSTPINLELKEPGIESAALEICKNAGIPVLYSSFYESALRELRRLDETAPIAVLCHEGIDDRLKLGEELDAVAFHPSLPLAVETDVVADAKARDFAVNAWTAETEADVQQLRELDIDGIITDRWDFF